MVFIICCITYMISLQPDLWTHHNAQRTYNQCSHYAATSMPPLNHLKLRALYITSLTFLGIYLNSKTIKASISDEKKHALLNEVTWMRHRHKCTQWELLSVVGKLSFCCKVLSAGKIFLRRMNDLSTMVARLYHCISLTTEAYLDIQWWIDFLPSWLGSSLILNTIWTPSLVFCIG